jgi:negative regulator of sigma E activity
MTFSDEQLMAYADGELDGDLRAQIETALASDAKLAAMVAAHQALRQRLRSELDATLSEPIPERLLAALRAPTMTSSAGDNVVELRSRSPNSITEPRQKWSLREWGAMAATLTLGISLGLFALNQNDQMLVTVRAGNLVAQGKLASALTEQLASTQSGGDAVQIGTSFNSRAGDYCRTFVVPQRQTLAGLACYRDAAWRVQALTEIKSGGADSANYRQAGSAMPAAIAALVNEEIADEPLDADAEAAARTAQWRH